MLEQADAITAPGSPGLKVKSSQSSSLQDHQCMNEQSPVDVIINIRKELADFQRTSSTEELRAALKVVCRAALPCRGHDRGSPGSSRV